MNCAGCAATIEKQLKQTHGIIDAQINYANEKAVVTYSRPAIRLSEIIDKISSLGYNAELQDDRQLTEGNDTTGIAYRKMLYSSIIAGLVMALMILKMTGLEIPAYHFITSLLGFPVVFVLGSSVHRSSWLSLKNRTANMDVLVSLGSLPPYIIGLGGFFWDVQTFIEMATAIMTFHLVGKFLETKAKGKTSEAIKRLIKLGAKTARVERNEREIEVSVQELEIGDLIVIKPGEKIPIDAVIIEGSSSIDESMVTGESMPVYREVGDEVIGATINRQGYFKARVSKTGKDTFLAQVISLVEQCQGSKVPIQDFADKVTGYFVPIIILLTFFTFLSYNIFPEFHRQIIS
jgi:Cu+-exporting ATPase